MSERIPSIAELIETRRAEALGRPIRQCPRCGVIPGDHYIPDTLDDDDNPVPGYWSCQPAPDPAPMEGLF